MILVDSADRQRRFSENGIESKVIDLPFMDPTKEVMSFDPHHMYIKTDFQNFNKFTGKMSNDNTSFGCSELGLVGSVVYSKFKKCDPIDMSPDVWQLACRTYARYVMENYIRNELYHLIRRFNMGRGSSVLMNPTTYEMFIQIMDIMDGNEKIGYRLKSDVDGVTFLSDLYRVPAEAKKRALERKVFTSSEDIREFEVQPPKQYTILSLWDDFRKRSSYGSKTMFGFFVLALEQASAIGIIRDPFIDNVVELSDSYTPSDTSNVYLREICDLLWIRRLSTGGPSIATEVVYNFLDGLGRPEFKHRHLYFGPDCGGWAEGIDRTYLETSPISFNRNAQPRNIDVEPVYACDDISFGGICSVSKHTHVKTYDIYKELVNIGHLVHDGLDCTVGYSKLNANKAHPIRGWLLRTGFYEFFENYTDIFDDIMSESDIDSKLWECRRRFNSIKKRVVKSLDNK